MKDMKMKMNGGEAANPQAIAVQKAIVQPAQGGIGFERQSALYAIMRELAA